ncbi:MAG: hypothetical protein MK008_01485 [Bdellovibrionales bacterium]|nr:hypothetical protein [Bdellovibrionales bacterium]
MKKFISLLLLCAFCAACGVKGPPLPPLKPPELSEGRKQFVDQQNQDEQKDKEKND